MVNQSQPSSIMVPKSTRSCHPSLRDVAWWLAPLQISTNTGVEFQLVVVGVIIQSLSDMSWSRYNSPESLHMMRRVPVIIGTPTIDRVVRVLKESEMDSILEEWQRAWLAHEYINGFFVRSMNPAESMPTNTWTLMRRSVSKINVPFLDSS